MFAIIEKNAASCSYEENQGKGLIARYVARKILSTKPTYCPKFLRRIADLVNSSLGFAVSTSDSAVEDGEDIPF